MKDIEYCPVCFSKDLKKYSARIDDWTFKRFLRKTNENSERLDIPPIYTMLCQDCRFAFCNIRFNQEEEQEYYQNYMTGEYVDGRGIQNIAEFYHSEKYINMRKAACWTRLEPYVSSVGSLLDFGGNTGDMIPDDLGFATRYVLDVEPRELKNGIKSVRYADPIKVDLIICGHTLEHLSKINEGMIQIKDRMNPGGILYMEVPDDNPGEFVDGITWYEHINLFSADSLKRLLNNHGFEVLFDDKIDYERPMCRSIAMVAKLPG